MFMNWHNVKYNGEVYAGENLLLLIMQILLKQYQLEFTNAKHFFRLLKFAITTKMVDLSFIHKNGRILLIDGVLSEYLFVVVQFPSDCYYIT